MYRILHEISRGAMGVVYRAEDLGLGRPVAIKVLRSDLARNLDLVSRFREDAAMLASLRHRNLVNVYSFGSEDEEVYFVMELVEGESLKDILLDLAHERSLPALLSELVERLRALPQVALARIWLIRPGDICATCPAREECPDQTRCLHLVASAASPIDEPSGTG